MSATVTELYLSRGLEFKKDKGRNKRGEEWCGPCPDCGGEDRFLVWPEQNDRLGSYACRGCNKAGDVIQFLRDFDGMSFAEACKAAGREAPQRRSSLKAPRRESERAGITAAPASEPGQLWQDKATNFALACHEALLGTPGEMEWLRRRGLPLAAVRRFKLGWNRGDGKNSYLIRPRKVWGLPDVPPKKDGDKAKTSLWLPRGLVVPQVGADGRARRLRIRRTEQDRKNTGFDLKFYVVPGSGMSPLWIEQDPGLLPPASCCLVVESELDAMAVAHAAGDICAVIGIMTAKVRSLPEAVMRKLGACARILVATDYGDKVDKSGRQAGEQGWELWRDTFPQARRWPCIRGCKDPGEMAQAGENIRRWIMAGLPDALLAMLMRERRPETASEVFAEAEDAGPEEQPLQPRNAREEASERENAADEPRETPEGIFRLLSALREFPFSCILKPDNGVRFESPARWRRENWELYRELTRLALSADVLGWLDRSFQGQGVVTAESLEEAMLGKENMLGARHG